MVSYYVLFCIARYLYTVKKKNQVSIFVDLKLENNGDMSYTFSKRKLRLNICKYVLKFISFFWLYIWFNKKISWPTCFLRFCFLGQSQIQWAHMCAHVFHFVHWIFGLEIGVYSEQEAHRATSLTWAAMTLNERSKDIVPHDPSLE